MNKHYIHITNPVYPVKFHVYLNYGIAEIKSKIKLKHKADIKGVVDELSKLDWDNADGYCPVYRGNIFILIKKFNGKADCYDSLHHEIVHAVFKAGEFLGFTHAGESEEFYAYMHGFLTNQIYKKLLWQKTL